MSGNLVSHSNRKTRTVRKANIKSKRIWESDYVYDVACRLRARLEERTAAHVVMTLEDKKTGCSPSRTDALQANLEAILADLRKAKPSSAKGVYMKAIWLSTTMGPGVAVDKTSLETA